MLDVCTVELLEKIKVLMRVDGNFVELAANTAAILFDSFLARRLPSCCLMLSTTIPSF